MKKARHIVKRILIESIYDDVYYIDDKEYYSVEDTDELINSLIETGDLKNFFLMHIIGLELTKQKAEIEALGIEEYDFPEGIDNVINGGKILLKAFEQAMLKVHGKHNTEIIKNKALSSVSKFISQ